MLIALSELFKGLLIALGVDRINKGINHLWSKIRHAKMTPEIKQIVEAFELFTTSYLRYSNFEIKNLKHINKNEVNEILSTWDGVDGLLLIGEGGSGKSGIVADVTRTLMKRHIPVLLVYADDLPLNQDPAISIENRLSIDTKLATAFNELGKFQKAVFIIDQLDTIAGTVAFEGYTSLLKNISVIGNVVVLGVTRTYEAKEIKNLKNLGFPYIQCDLLTFEETKRYIFELGMKEPTDNIVDLGRNLLNLSLIADVISNKKDITHITGEIELWLKFVETVKL